MSEETRIAMTEAQFRSLVKSIWDEGFSEGWHDGVGMQNESVSQHADSRFWLSNAETTVNKLIELERASAGVDPQPGTFGGVPIGDAPDLLKAIDTLLVAIGLAAFKYDAQRAVVQEAVDLAIAAKRRALQGGDK